MASNVDKSLSQAPRGLRPEDFMTIDSMNSGEDPLIEIEIEDEAEDAEDAPLDDFETDDAPNAEFEQNLAETLDKSLLSTIAGELNSEFDEDLNSRKDWIQTYIDGLELLGMGIEERTEPWEGACGVFHPLLSETLVRFQAETMSETFPAQGPVRTQILGQESQAKRDAAKRVEEDMNWQLTECMVEYRSEHERMLWGLGLSGNAFKKVYFDPALDRQTAVYVAAEDVVVPFGASNLESAGRVTHVMRKTPNELRKLQVSGFYRDIPLPEPTGTLDEIEQEIAKKTGFQATTDDRYKLLEMQVYLTLEDDDFRDKEDDDIGLPYIVTIEKDSQEVLAIRRNWKPDDPQKLKRAHFVHYSYVPGFGFYAFGLIHLLGGFAKSGTSLIRQLVDAGTLSNLPGGFKTKGLRVKGDDTPIAPGEWRDVDVASGTMRDNIMPLPYKEPSQTLFALFQNIIEEARRFAGTAELQVSDMSAQAPVGTTLAILERMLKVMSAVQSRIHFSMKQEFKLLKAIIRDYTPDSYTYDPQSSTRKAKKDDYDTTDVIPVSDPNAATMAQKIVQYQAVVQLATTAPQIYDLPYLHRQMLEVLGIKNAAKLVPLKDGSDMHPEDPITENMNLLNSKPVKAFLYQDHESHIAVHMSMSQDPKIAALVGQNPAAQTIMAAGAAHVMEHLAFAYRKQIEEQAGVPLPPPGSELDPNIEMSISRLAAAAAQQLLKNNQAQAQQQQNMQNMQDPLVQMQQKQLQQKDRELDLKEKKLQIDATNMADVNKIAEDKILSAEKVAGLRVGAKIATDKANLSAQQQEAGLKLGVDIAGTQLDHHASMMQPVIQAATKSMDTANEFNPTPDDQPEPKVAPGQPVNPPQPKGQRSGGTVRPKRRR